VEIKPQRPSFDSLPSFLLAKSRSLSLKRAFAFLKSLSVSVRAYLHAERGAPVIALNVLTSAIDTLKFLLRRFLNILEPVL